MNTFYPIPFCLLFIQILLLVGSQRGAEGRVYGDSCKENLDCKDTKWCNRATKLCDCLELSNIPGVNTVQIFHSVKRSCFSPVGSLCFIRKKNIFQLDCVPHAECIRDSRVNHLASDFGLCSCAPGYFRDYNRLCEKEVEMVTEKKIVDLDLGDIFSSRFNGRVGVVDDANANTIPQEMPRAEKVKDDVDNENGKFWIPESKMNKLVKADSSGGNRVKDQFNCIVGGVTTLLIFAQFLLLLQ